MGRAAFGYYVSLFCEGGRGRGLLSGGFCQGAYVQALMSYTRKPHLCAALCTTTIIQCSRIWAELIRAENVNLHGG